MSEIKLEWEIPAILGEGPLWVAEEQAIYWVDIVAKQVHRFGTVDGSKKSWQFDFEVTSLVQRESGGWLATVRDGFVFFDLETGSITPIEMPETHLPDNRFNDGKVDAQGRFWAGTMDEGEAEQSGTLYRLDPDMSMKVVDGDYIIANGPAFSPDGKVLYHNDTTKRCIYAYDLNADGSVSNKRVLVQFGDKSEGSPDGLTVDVNGDLWQASFGGHRITRFSSEGEVKQVLEMPVPNITSCTFGGENLDTLYITTARCLLDEETLKQYPLAGSLFSYKPGVKGLPTTKFAG